MRTRTRSVVTTMAPAFTAATLPYTFNACDGQIFHSSLGVGSVPSRPLVYEEERISDELGKGSSHPVIHRKRSVKGNAQYPIYARGGYDTSINKYGWYTVPDNTPALPAAYMPTVEGHTTWDVSSIAPGPLARPLRWTLDMSQINESSLKEDCLEKANSLKADHLLNLSEANQLWPTIQSLVKPYDSLKRNWKAIRRLVRTASGDYLAWKFGISPLLSDVMATTRYASQFERDLKRFADQDANRFKAVAKIPCRFDDVVVDPQFLNGIKIYHVTVQGRMQGPAEVRYVLVVKPNVKYFTNFFKKLDLIVQRFGTSPAQFAWEIVPFSFVADWFLDLRGVCRAADKLVGYSPYQIVSFTRSESFNLATDVFQDAWACCASHANVSSCKMGTVEFKSYERSLVSPAASWPTWKPRYGKTQMAITAALIAQRMR